MLPAAQARHGSGSEAARRLESVSVGGWSRCEHTGHSRKRAKRAV
jgi:hypothetical protein